MIKKFNEIINNLSKLVNEDSEQINNLLSNIGVSKEDAIKKIESLDKGKIIEELKDERIKNKINSLSSEDMQKIKKLYNDIQNKKEK